MLVRVDDFIYRAFKRIGTPYIFGAKGDNLDCSGLVSCSLVDAGHPKNCPTCGKDMLGFHSAQRFYDEGIPVAIENAARGHCAFFGHDDKHVSHVGILLGGDLMLEAGGGDETTTTLVEAKRRGACVRVERTWRWKNLVGVRALPLIGP